MLPRTGAEEPFALGMRAFVRRERKVLDRERTVFVNLDEVGAGTIRYTRREGLVITARSHVQLVDLCEEIADDDDDAGGDFQARPLTSRTKSDGYVARSAGFPAITVSCRNALDYAPHHHRADDTPEHLDDDALERAFGFCSELVERLDATIGPDLSEPEREPDEAAA